MTTSLRLRNLNCIKCFIHCHYAQVLKYYANEGMCIVTLDTTYNTCVYCQSLYLPILKEKRRLLYYFYTVLHTHSMHALSPPRRTLLLPLSSLLDWLLQTVRMSLRLDNISVQKTVAFMVYIDVKTVHVAINRWARLCIEHETQDQFCNAGIHLR